jgi:hypothetical protein
MVVVYYHPLFKKQVKKIKDGKLKAKVKRQIQKIVEYPEIGKPMKYAEEEPEKYTSLLSVFPIYSRKIMIVLFYYLFTTKTNNR